ncbi:MAG: hypothetical protein RJB23_469 [Pseudomonadota bacterium]
MLIETICEEMKMKSKKEIKTSKILEKNENLENSKMSKNSDENNFVCKQNDKDCWHRYSSAMGDCV